MSQPGDLLLARYRLRHPIGRGTQGETWVAHDEQSGAQVALKLFRLAEHHDWKPFELFERECRVLRSLDHPCIPRYLDHGADEDQGLFFLAMQHIEGRTLAEHIASQRRFTETALLELFDQLLGVLEYLHALQPVVVHRDLSPNNVILDPSGRAWLVDFGGVREAFVDDRASTIIGTHGYTAPEQLVGAAGPSSDLYSLGATMTAVATGVDAGRLPHNGLEIDLEHVLPAGRLRHALAQVLWADPRRRTTSAATLRQQLRRAPGASPQSVARVRPPVASTPAPASTEGVRRAQRALLIFTTLAFSGGAFALVLRVSVGSAAVIALGLLGVLTVVALIAHLGQAARSERERAQPRPVKVPGTATIVQMRDTGMAHDQRLELDLVVDILDTWIEGPSGSVPLRVRTRCLVPRMATSRVMPGASVPIRYDPQRPSRLSVDWAAMGYVV